MAQAWPKVSKGGCPTLVSPFFGETGWVIFPQRQRFSFGQSCARVPNFAPLQIKTSILFSSA